MKMGEVRKMAKKHKINSFGKSKKDLILEIQRAEGNFDCFGKANTFCDQHKCCFRSLCLGGYKIITTKPPPLTQSHETKDYYNTNYLLAGMYSMKN